MQISEHLSRCAKIPYNSAYEDLPEPYREECLKWGLNCFGFAMLTASEFPNTQIITGRFQRGLGHIVHAATLIDEYYVDPTLRMTDGLPIYGEKSYAVPTFYEGSAVSGNMDTGNGVLTVELKRGWFKINTYQFKPGEELRPKHGQAYNFTVLNNGRPITIAQTISPWFDSEVVIKGASNSEADGVLQSEYGLSLSEVISMQRDASDNYRYSRSHGSWR